MDRAIRLCGSFVTLPIESRQCGGTFELEIALSKVLRLDDEMEAEHGRFQLVNVFGNRIELKKMSLSLDGKNG
jgi:hypothetical protein